MLNVIILAVGKMKDKWMTQGIGEYEKRLKGYCQFSVVEISEHKLSLKPSDADIAIGLEKEGEQILSKIPPRAKVMVLCIEGKMLSSEELSHTLEKYSGETSQVVFIIGSSHGLSPKVKQVADFKLSMSPMTFPHQLARVVLCEQIYRALSITAGAKYHK